jgi:hypothetical protein
MPFRAPFAGVERRVAWLRGTLLAAGFLGLIASTPAWSNTRGFPLVPIASWFPILPPPTDKFLFAGMLASLIFAIWFYRGAVVFFLAASLIEFCQDQNRGQPWLYMYWVMLLLSLAPAGIELAANRIALSVVYAWSGIQKLNARFFEVIPSWFLGPMTKWHLPQSLFAALKMAVAVAPFIEIAIAIFLWAPRLRRLAIVATVILHGVSLILLSPLGHNYNWVVWPWNLAMIALVWGLFSNSKLFQPSENAPAPPTPSPSPSGQKSKTRPTRESKAAADSIVAVPALAQTLRKLRESKRVMAMLLLYALLPLFSYAGLWDSYFSFSLYAENSAHANIFITQTFADRLPAGLRKYVQPFPQAFDPLHQGPLMLAFDPWCYEELHIPPIPEVRNFKAIYQYFRTYAKKPEELRMIIGPRAGPVIFLQGDEIELLKPR